MRPQVENRAQSRASQYREKFEYLVKSGICNEVRAVSDPRFPLSESESKNLLKLYLNDVGLLTRLLYQYNITAVMDDIRSINLGSVYESVVCSELSAHGYTLFYYDNKKKGEVDFLINDYDTLTVIPLEVKSGKDYQIHAALDSLVAGQEHPVHTAIVLSNDRQVHEKEGILYLPVYFSMFLAPSTPKEVFF